jgi:glycerol kinase
MRFVNNDSWQIRRLQQSDVHQLLELISGVRREFGLATRVASLLEPNDYAILDVYRHRRSAYFVATKDNHVLGGAGISPLANEAMRVTADISESTVQRPRHWTTSPGCLPVHRSVF